jgi:hypothetical protein
MRIEKTSQTVFTPLADGTGVLLNVDTLAYYSLNHVGAVLWQQIEGAGALVLDELVRNTCERFVVDEQTARREVKSFVELLGQYKMVRVA